MAELTDEQIHAQLRKEVRAWAMRQRDALLFKAAGMGLNETGELLASIKQKVRTKEGIPTRVTFSFARQGILQQLGVGRGTSIKQVGSTTRKPKPWISEALTQAAADELADIVAGSLGDKAVGSVKIGVPTNTPQ